MVADWIEWLAHFPFKEHAWFSVGHTISAEKPLIPGSEMSAFFLGITPFVRLNRLCQSTINAEIVLQVVPISENERQLTIDNGPDVLLQKFDASGVEPLFDLERTSCL